MERQKITVINFYDIRQLHHGGVRVMQGLYSALSEWFDVTLVTFHEDLDIFSDKIWINKKLYLSTIAKSDELKEIEKEYHKEVGFDNMGIIDPSLAASRYYADRPELVSAIQKIAEDSAIVITEHPYTYRVLKRAIPAKTIWYRAQNVEYDYKHMAWRHCENHEALEKEVYDLEKECCDGCDLILTITQADANRFHKLYKLPVSKLLSISAGTDIFSFKLPGEREKLSADYNESALFLSSYIEASANAARRVLELAKATPAVMYYMAGDVCRAIEPNDVPDNLLLLGIVSEEDKEKYLNQADFALNLIEGGSGMNVKMLEYFAHGLPVITTEFGKRGISVTDKTHCLVTSIENVENAVNRFCKMDRTKRDVMAVNAYELVKSEYSWNNCVDRILEYLSENDKRLYEIIRNTHLVDSKTEIGNNSIEVNLDKTRKYYIFGAGYYGKKCMSLLSGLGIIPIGIIDNNTSLWGSIINQVTVYPPQHFFKEIEADIIIATQFFFPAIDILRQLVDNTVSLNRIYLAIEGINLFSCGSNKGYNPNSYNAGKLVEFSKERQKHQ
ncbi:MAG: glycosyltransferase family 4 protein [Oscillospiraceae bacterium]|nr:glycosyltransferase family 4 protein [Oscillospiraceae bacterium]